MVTVSIIDRPQAEEGRPQLVEGDTVIIFDSDSEFKAYLAAKYPDETTHNTGQTD